MCPFTSIPISGFWVQLASSPALSQTLGLGGAEGHLQCFREVPYEHRPQGTDLLFLHREQDTLFPDSPCCLPLYPFETCFLCSSSTSMVLPSNLMGSFCLLVRRLWVLSPPSQLEKELRALKKHKTQEEDFLQRRLASSRGL
ncbi:hypothetical protein LIER_26277 [Lithospermum erythrorhizon]|uniref:Uncharacterized protein n=1 Tax=Lithospermum erythrorhizon TaxID=34254 RepID=A0AAV3RDL8_LITER